MIRLECDYAEGAHERVLRRLFETNLEQTPGYGEDAYCAQARARIRALCENEALVLALPALQRDFRYHLKQHGGMLAKGRLLGVQFEAMLEDGLYFDLARRADRLALDLRRALEERGYAMLYDSPTNQQYPILPDELVEHLEADFAFSFWKKVDQDHTAVRLCTSWATEPAAIQALIRAVDRWEEG